MTALGYGTYTSNEELNQYPLDKDGGITKEIDLKGKVLGMETVDTLEKWLRVFQLLQKPNDRIPISRGVINGTMRTLGLIKKFLPQKIQWFPPSTSRQPNVNLESAFTLNSSLIQAVYVQYLVYL